MSTNEKLEKYETALHDWIRKLKEWKANPSFTGTKPPEPNAADYNLTASLEVWAAAKVRSRLVSAWEEVP